MGRPKQGFTEQLDELDKVFESEHGEAASIFMKGRPRRQELRALASSADHLIENEDGLLTTARGELAAMRGAHSLAHPGEAGRIPGLTAKQDEVAALAEQIRQAPYTGRDVVKRYPDFLLATILLWRFTRTLQPLGTRQRNACGRVKASATELMAELKAQQKSRDEYDSKLKALAADGVVVGHHECVCLNRRDQLILELQNLIGQIETEEARFATDEAHARGDTTAEDELKIIRAAHRDLENAILKAGKAFLASKRGKRLHGVRRDRVARYDDLLGSKKFDDPMLAEAKMQANQATIAFYHEACEQAPEIMQGRVPTDNDFGHLLV